MMRRVKWEDFVVRAVDALPDGAETAGVVMAAVLVAAYVAAAVVIAIVGSVWVGLGLLAMPFALHFLYTR